MRWWKLGVAVCAVGTAMGALAQDGDPQFAAWVDDFKQQAAQTGIPPAVIEDAFTAFTEPNENIIRLDRKQPEDTVSFGDYMANTVTDKRVEQGRQLMLDNAELLKQIGDHYHVQPRFIVALWGIETSYGVNKGNFSLIESLGTLAYEGRRADFFRTELMNALKIMDSEHIAAADLTGSWAGAMGNCQFMPTSFLQFAVDWDKDGKRDIWNSLPDTFASIANYLHLSGWSGDVGWGGPVTAPENFKEEEARLDRPRYLREWAARGLTMADGSPLPHDPYLAYAVYPGDPWEGVYLVSDNFRVLLRWNRSRYFATAVGTLADRIVTEE